MAMKIQWYQLADPPAGADGSMFFDGLNQALVHILDIYAK